MTTMTGDNMSTSTFKVECPQAPEDGPYHTLLVQVIHTPGRKETRTSPAEPAEDEIMIPDTCPHCKRDFTSDQLRAIELHVQGSLDAARRVQDWGIDL